MWCWATTWSKKPSMRSAGLRRPAGSGTARSLSPTSRKQSGSERGSPDWTRSDARGPALIPELFSRKGTHDDGQECPEDDQGQRREIRRLSFHRSARQVAARDLRQVDDRGGYVGRRPDVRRLID